MNGPINQIFGHFNNQLHQSSENSVHFRALNHPHVNHKESSHKYIIENNLIVYEKYDHHGKLISKVPWSSKSIDKKA